MAQPDKPIEVFISYSKHDLPLLEQLVSHLSNLLREKQINIWYDRQMTAGEEWSDEINERLNSAGMVFLLVSRDFLSSKYCFDVELPRIIERQDKGETKVIPILLRACEWEKAAFSQYQLLPSDRIPVASWPNTDEAFRDVAIGIRKAVEKLRAKPEQIGADQPPTNWLSRSKMKRPLLPYLCDRSEQEIELGVGLRNHQAQRSTRPIVCLIHGDELECHGGFLERLQYVSLPKFLDLELRQVSVRDCCLDPLHRVSDQMLWANLGAKLLGGLPPTQQEIWRFISSHEEPMMIIRELLTEDFAECGESLIESLVEFCGKWEELPPGRLVINCICLKYQRFDRSVLPESKKKKLRQLNKRLRDQVENMDSSLYPNVSVIVLPELCAIKRSDVELWSSKVCPVPEREIRAWFEDKELCNKEGHIPMEYLEDKLREFV